MAYLTNCDFFDRPDGGLGSDWDTVPFLWQDSTDPLIIIDEAAEDGRGPGDGAYRQSAARYVIAQPPNQAIEAEITRLWQPSPADVGTSHYAMLLTNMTTTDQSLRMLEVFTDVNFPDNVSLNFLHFDADGNSSDNNSQDVAITSLADFIRVRFESDPDGAYRAYVDDVLVLTGVDPNPAPGTFCGVATSSYDHLGTISQWIDSVRFNEVCFPGSRWNIGWLGPSR